MSAPVIEISHVSKRYRLGEIGVSSLREEFSRWFGKLTGRKETSAIEKRDFWALKDVSFDIQPGDVVGVIGRNGAGKSTLLKVLSRITEPTEGRITLRGRVASLLEVGTGFHPELSGRDNIFLNGAILGMKKAEIRAKFDEIVAFSEVGKFIDTPVKRYSSGMYVRLAFAVAAHLEPEILIVDEVLAVGDQKFQQKCLGKIQQIASGQGRTILFVSHNIAAVRDICNKAAWMANGQLQQFGDSETVTKAYLNSLAAPAAKQTRSKAGILLEDIYLSEEPDGAPTQVPIFGRSYYLTLTFNTDKPFRNAALQVQIDDTYGNRISSISGLEEGFDFDLTGRTRILIHLPELQLYPRRYVVNVGIFRQFEQLSFEANAVTDFEVQSALLPNATWQYNQAHGAVRICRKIEQIALPQSQPLAAAKA